MINENPRQDNQQDEQSDEDHGSNDQQSSLVAPSHIGQPTHQPVLQHAPAAPVPQVTGTPTQADDVDLIEKAWVEKAKEIVHSTQGDPFTQSKQLNQMKAEYIKKRYNRDVHKDE